MRSPRAVAIACIAVVFVIAAFALARLATHGRDDLTAVATPPPVLTATPVTLDPGQQLCEDDVALETASRVIRFYSGSPTPDVPRLRVTVRGDGWQTSTLSPPTGERGGGADGIYDTRIAAPPRSLMATVCVASASTRQPAILAGSDEPAIRTRSQTTVDGEPIGPRVALLVLAGGQRSPLSQVRTVLEHAASFQPAPVGWVGLGLLLVVVGLGTPALAAYAVLRALRDGEGD
jgi:hypothetical protein